jgi:hypothetical protein
MNSTLQLAAIALCATLVVPATAQEALQRIDITAPRVDTDRVLSEHESEATYDMSTGRRLPLASTGQALQMRYGRHLRRTLHAGASGEFVSADGLVRMAFDLDGYGVRQVRLSLPAGWQ